MIISCRWVTVLSALALTATLGLVLAGWQWSAAVKERDVTQAQLEQVLQEKEQAKIRERAALTERELAKQFEGEVLKQQALAQERQAVAKEETAQAEAVLAKAIIQLERASLEEGRALFDRARVAEQSNDHFMALMLAGRSVGFFGYGRKEQEAPKFEEQFPALLGKSMSEPEFEVQRVAESTAVNKFIKDTRPTMLPIWASPKGQHHAGCVNSVAFSSEGTRLASASDDYTVKIWDVATGKEIACLSGHEHFVYSVAFSKDGSRLASGSWDHTVKIWDVASAQEVATLSGHEDSVNSVAFSPDGSRLVSGSSDNSIKLWDLASGQEIASLSGHEHAVSSVEFSPDGSQLASGSDDKTVRIWDAGTGQQLMILSAHEEWVGSVAFSPDGSRLASGSWDGTAKLWDVASGRQLSSFSGRNFITSVTFSPDASRLICGVGENVKIWDVASGKQIASLSGHSDLVHCVAVSPDGAHAASASDDDTVRLWDLNTNECKTMVSGHRLVINDVAFSPDGSQLASASEDLTIKIWDLATGEESITLSGHFDAVNAVAFSPDGAYLASGSDDETVRMWNAVSGQELGTFHGHSSSVESVAFSPDGTRLASGAWDDVVRIWDVASGQELASLYGHREYIDSLAFSPGGSLLASGSDDMTVKIWEVASGQEITSLSGHDETIHSVAFSPDGTRLVSGSNDRVKIWNAMTWQLISSLSGHNDQFESVVLSPDGSQLASAGSGNIRLWDIASGQEIGSFLGSEHVVSVVFSPDGARLASGSNESVKLWDINSAEGDASLDLVHFQREGLFKFVDRAIAWSTNSSLFDSLAFTPNFSRPDELSALAAPKLDLRDHTLLRFGLLSKTLNWRATIALWNAVVEEQASLAEDITFQKAYAKALLTCASKEAHLLPNRLAPELVTAILTGFKPYFLNDPELSKPLGQALTQYLLNEAALPEDLLHTFLNGITTDAPQDWLEEVAETAEKAHFQKDDVSDASRARLAALIEPMVQNHPQSLRLTRAYVHLLPATSERWLPIVNKFLAMPDATCEDFTDAAYAVSKPAAHDSTLADAVRDIIRDSEERFPDEETIPQMAGWSLLNIGDKHEAHAAFRKAQSLVESDETLQADLLAGLAISSWLVDQHEEAIQHYKALIEGDAEWAKLETIKNLDWTEAETTPLKAARSATLKAHPEIFPDTESDDDTERGEGVDEPVPDKVTESEAIAD